MTLRAKLFLASCALAALSLSACGGAANSNAGPANASNAARPANAAATPAAPAATPAAPAANSSAAPSSAGVTGVAACDEYIALYERCINNPSVPEAMKGAWRNSLEQSRTAWRQAASTPEGKAQLATTCPQMLASARPQLEQFCK